MADHDEWAFEGEGEGSADGDWVYVDLPRAGGSPVALDEAPMVSAGSAIPEPAAEVSSPSTPCASHRGITSRLIIQSACTQVAAASRAPRSYAEAVCAGPFRTPSTAQRRVAPRRVCAAAKAITQPRPSKQSSAEPLPRWGECQFPMF